MEMQKTDLIAWATLALAGAGIENARFEAQLLLAMMLGIARSSVVAQTYAVPGEEQRTRFTELVRQRTQRVPLAYLRGSQEFYGREFLVTPAVLVPRPETELLVEKILALIKLALIKNELSAKSIAEITVGKEANSDCKKESTTKDLEYQKSILMADVGTGSGCIPVSILGEQPAVRALAFDLSHDALVVAHQNAAANGAAERMRFVQGDLLTGARRGSLDIVVSNPPYIPSCEIASLQREVSEYEPRLALDGGADGLAIYRRLIEQAYQALKSPGWLFLEIGRGQVDDVVSLLHKAGFEAIQSVRDLAGIERVVQGQKM